MGLWAAPADAPDVPHLAEAGIGHEGHVTRKGPLPMLFTVKPVEGGSAQAPWASQASSPMPLLIITFHPPPCT